MLSGETCFETCQSSVMELSCSNLTKREITFLGSFIDTLSRMTHFNPQNSTSFSRKNCALYLHK